MRESFILQARELGLKLPKYCVDQTKSGWKEDLAKANSHVNMFIY